jgi:hypothetical protein
LLHRKFRDLCLVLVSEMLLGDDQI